GHTLMRPLCLLDAKHSKPNLIDGEKEGCLRVQKCNTKETEKIGTIRVRNARAGQIGQQEEEQQQEEEVVVVEVVIMVVVATAVGERSQYYVKKNQVRKFIRVLDVHDRRMKAHLKGAHKSQRSENHNNSGVGAVVITYRLGVMHLRLRN